MSLLYARRMAINIVNVRGADYTTHYISEVLFLIQVAALSISISPVRLLRQIMVYRFFPRDVSPDMIVVDACEGRWMVCGGEEFRCRGDYIVL